MTGYQKPLRVHPAAAIGEEFRCGQEQYLREAPVQGTISEPNRRGSVVHWDGRTYHPTLPSDLEDEKPAYISGRNLIDFAIGLDGKGSPVRLSYLKDRYPGVYRSICPPISRLPFFTGIIELREVAAKAAEDVSMPHARERAQSLRSYNTIKGYPGTLSFPSSNGDAQELPGDKKEAFMLLAEVGKEARELLARDEEPVEWDMLVRTRRALDNYQETAFSLYAKNMGLAHRALRSRGIPRDSALSDACETAAQTALLRAVLAYDLGRGYQFSTYATSVIGSAISVVCQREKDTISLQYRRDDQSTELGQSIPDRSAPPSRGAEEAEMREILGNALEGLDTPDFDLLAGRLGLFNSGVETLQHIADRKDLSKERIRQLQEDALDEVSKGVPSSLIP